MSAAVAPRAGISDPSGHTVWGAPEHALSDAVPKNSGSPGIIT